MRNVFIRQDERYIFRIVSPDDHHFQDDRYVLLTDAEYRTIVRAENLYKEAQKILEKKWENELS